MNIIYLLLSVSVGVAILFFYAFIQSVKRGQYDDTYTPSIRMLFEDESDVKHTISSKDSKASNTIESLTKNQSL